MNELIKYFRIIIILALLSSFTCSNVKAQWEDDWVADEVDVWGDAGDWDGPDYFYSDDGDILFYDDHDNLFLVNDDGSLSLCPTCDTGGYDFFGDDLSGDDLSGDPCFTASCSNCCDMGCDICAPDPCAMAACSNCCDYGCEICKSTIYDPCADALCSCCDAGCSLCDPDILPDVSVSELIIEKALKVVAKSQTYGHDFPRNYTNKTLDCSEFVFQVLKDASPKLATKIGGDGKYVNTKSFYEYITKNGEFRTIEPKVGDFVMWYTWDSVNERQHGHIEIITKVNGERFVMYGAGSGKVPRFCGESNGYMWLSSKYESSRNDDTIEDIASGEYRGFWTPKQ